MQLKKLPAIVIVSTWDLPFLLWDWTGYSIDAARIVGLSCQVPAQNSSHQSEGKDDKQADAKHCHLQNKNIQFIATNLWIEMTIFQATNWTKNNIRCVSTYEVCEYFRCASLHNYNLVTISLYNKIKKWMPIK